MKTIILLLTSLLATGGLMWWLAASDRLEWLLAYPVISRSARLASQGPAGTFDLIDGNLVPNQDGRISVLKPEPGLTIVRIDRGGGHLGARGFIFDSGGTTDAATVQQKAGLIHLEQCRLTKLPGEWWYYRSGED
jgi:hypothetical protein